ncbi:MAG TPA: MauE/DoxX family redox-associated membrane protein [Jatrophihabitans sp.]|nr:MauE/DoxX family redox-associated membrane protein [Jatrophihabitans sp.]
MSVLILCAATSLLITFVTALIGKTRSRVAFQEFAFSLKQHGVRAAPAQRRLAAVVVLAELVAVAALLGFGAHSVARFGPSVLLLAVFSAAIARSGSGGAAVDCHCFGVATTLPVRMHLMLNGVLAGLGLVAMFAPSTHSTTDAEWVLGVGLGAILGLLVVFASDLYLALSLHPLQDGDAS